MFNVYFIRAIEFKEFERDVRRRKNNTVKILIAFCRAFPKEGWGGVI